MTIVEFLRARLDEDERAARAVLPLEPVFVMGGERLDEEFRHRRLTFAGEDGYPKLKVDAEAATHFARHDPARVLREVEAQRRIVDWALTQQVPGSTIGDDFLYPLYALAAAHRDHPDYDPTWSPA